MLNPLANWLDERTGYRALVHEALEEPIPYRPVDVSVDVQPDAPVCEAVGRLPHPVQDFMNSLPSQVALTQEHRRRRVEEQVELHQPSRALACLFAAPFFPGHLPHVIAAVLVLNVTLFKK